MREIVVISGKGGTGKTSVCASLAHLAQNKVVCDLDVDAPDLHILLEPNTRETHAFVSGHNAVHLGTQHPDPSGGLHPLRPVCRFVSFRSGTSA